MLKNNRRISLFFLFIIVLVIYPIIDINSFLYPTNTYADVNIYYEIGKAICNGKFIYRDIFDTKGPYMFFIGAISYKFFNNFLFFYILDFISIFMYIYYSFKIYEKFVSIKNAFFFCLFNIFTLFFLYEMGSPEGMLIGIITYFIYWLINNGFNKDNKFIFLFFGIVFIFIFLTKLNYLLPFCFIAFLYLLNSFKTRSIKKFFIEILFFFIGVILSYLPLFIYELINKSPFYLIKTYILGAIGYADDFVEFELNLLILNIFIFIYLFLIAIINLNILSKNIRINLVMFFSMTLISILITKRIYFYYIYLLIPFFTLIILSFFWLLTKINNKILKIIALSIFCILFLSQVFPKIDLLKNQSFQKEEYHTYKFYEDYKDRLDKDSLILGLFGVDTLCTYYFEDQPNYKYFINLNMSYDIWKNVYDEYLEKIENKEFDCILINGKILDDNKVRYLITGNLKGEDDLVTKFIQLLNDKYVIDNSYEYTGYREKDNLKHTFVLIPK